MRASSQIKRQNLHQLALAAPSFGLIIIRAKDEAEARRIADADPMHAAGARSYELYAWSLNEGCINVKLNFSDQSFAFE